MSKIDRDLQTMNAHGLLLPSNASPDSLHRTSQMCALRFAAMHQLHMQLQPICNGSLVCLYHNLTHPRIYVQSKQTTSMQNFMFHIDAQPGFAAHVYMQLQSAYQLHAEQKQNLVGAQAGSVLDSKASSSGDACSDGSCCCCCCSVLA